MAWSDNLMHIYMSLQCYLANGKGSEIGIFILLLTAEILALSVKHETSPQRAGTRLSQEAG